MNKKEYTKPQVRKYSVAGATAMFAVSPEKTQVKVNDKTEFVNGGDDTEGKEAQSRHYDGWNWED